MVGQTAPKNLTPKSGKIAPRNLESAACPAVNVLSASCRQTGALLYKPQPRHPP